MVESDSSYNDEINKENESLIEEAKIAIHQAMNITDQSWSAEFDITKKWLTLLEKFDKETKHSTWEYSSNKYSLIAINNEAIEISFDCWVQCTDTLKKSFLNILYKQSIDWWILITTIENIIQREWTSDEWKIYLNMLIEEMIAVRFLKTEHIEMEMISKEVQLFIPKLFWLFDHKELSDFLVQMWTIAPDFFPRKFLSTYTFLSQLPGIDSTWVAFLKKELNLLIVENTYRSQITEIPNDFSDIVCDILKKWINASCMEDLKWYFWKYHLFNDDLSDEVLDWDIKLLPLETRHYLFQLFTLLPWSEKNRALIQWRKENLMTPDSLSRWKEMVDEWGDYEHMLDQWVFDVHTMAKLATIKLMQNLDATKAQMPEWNRETVRKMFLQWFKKKMKNLYTKNDLVRLMNSFHYVWDWSDIPEVQELIDMMSDIIALDKEIDGYKYTMVSWVKMPVLIHTKEEKKELRTLQRLWKEHVIPFFQWVGKSLRTRRNIDLEWAIAVNWKNDYENTAWSNYFQKVWDKVIMKNVWVLNKIGLKKETLSKVDTWRYLDNFFHLLDLGDAWPYYSVIEFLPIISDEKNKLPMFSKEIVIEYITQKFWWEKISDHYDMNIVKTIDLLLDYFILQTIKNDNDFTFNYLCKLRYSPIQPRILLKIDEHSSWTIWEKLLKDNFSWIMKTFFKKNFTLEKLELAKRSLTLSFPWTEDGDTFSISEKTFNNKKYDISLALICHDLVWSNNSKEEKSSWLLRLQSLKSVKDSIIPSWIIPWDKVEYFDIEARNSEWVTPLMKACEVWDLVMFDLLLAARKKKFLDRSSGKESSHIDIETNNIFAYVARCTDSKKRRYMLDALKKDMDQDKSYEKWQFSVSLFYQLLCSVNDEKETWIMILAYAHEFEWLRMYFEDNPDAAFWYESQNYVPEEILAKIVLSGDLEVWKFCMEYYNKKVFSSHWYDYDWITGERYLSFKDDYKYEINKKILYSINENSNYKNSASSLSSLVEVPLTIHPSKEYLDKFVPDFSEEVFPIWNNSKLLNRSPKLFSTQIEYSLPDDTVTKEESFSTVYWGLLELAFVSWSYAIFEELLSYWMVHLEYADNHEYVQYIIIIRRFLQFLCEEDCKSDEENEIYNQRFLIMKNMISLLPKDFIDRHFHIFISISKDTKTMGCLFNYLKDETIFLEKINKRNFDSMVYWRRIKLLRGCNIFLSLWDLIENNQKYTHIASFIEDIKTSLIVSMNNK